MLAHEDLRTIIAKATILSSWKWLLSFAVSRHGLHPTTKIREAPAVKLQLSSYLHSQAVQQITLHDSVKFGQDWLISLQVLTWFSLRDSAGCSPVGRVRNSHWRLQPDTMFGHIGQLKTATFCASQWRNTTTGHVHKSSVTCSCARSCVESHVEESGDGPCLVGFSKRCETKNVDPTTISDIFVQRPHHDW